MTYWWLHLPESMRFRVRFMIFQVIIDALLVIVAAQRVLPLGLVLVTVIVLTVAGMTFVAHYGIEEIKWREKR